MSSTGGRHSTAPEIVAMNNSPAAFMLGQSGMTRMVWHGTKASYLPSILQNGLALPNRQSGLFGNGIYFADSPTKSYCYTDRKSGRPHGASSSLLSPESILLLCEVDLGAIYALGEADSTLNGCAPNNKDCTWGVGKQTPDPNQHTYTVGLLRPAWASAGDHRAGIDPPAVMCCWPIGTMVPRDDLTGAGGGSVSASNAVRYEAKVGAAAAHHPTFIKPTLAFNEFIVYDPKRVRVRYVVRVK